MTEQAMGRAIKDRAGRFAPRGKGYGMKGSRPTGRMRRWQGVGTEQGMETGKKAAGTVSRLLLSGKNKGEAVRLSPSGSHDRCFLDLLSGRSGRWA